MMDIPIPTFVFGLIATLIVFGFFSVFIRNSNENDSAANTAGPFFTGRSRGLDTAIINTLPTFLYSEVKHSKIGKGALECAVCLNEFDDNETLRLLPKCDHVFHPECIDAWLSSHTTCPVCRANLAEPDSDAPITNAGTVEPNVVIDRSSVTIQVEEVIADNAPRSGSKKSTIWSKFPRSHSTGHSLVQPGENVERFTLKLPDQIREEIMTRALNQTTSLSNMPRETSSRSGYRRLGSLDRPNRWMFSMAPSFLSQESSLRKSNRSASGSEGTDSSKRFNLIGRLSFKRFGGSKSGEPGLI